MRQYNKCCIVHTKVSHQLFFYYGQIILLQNTKNEFVRVHGGATFLFSTGHIRYHVFYAGVVQTRQRCNRHKMSTADFRFRGSRLTRAIPDCVYISWSALYIQWNPNRPSNLSSANE